MAEKHVIEIFVEWSKYGGPNSVVIAGAPKVLLASDGEIERAYNLFRPEPNHE
jgi:hypothetical protein